VVGTHPRSGLSRLWHGSVANGVLHHAPMSVLIVPAPESAAPAGRVRPFRDVLATTDLSPLGDAGVGPAYAMLPAGGTVFLLHVLEHGQPIEARAARDRLEALVPVDADARGVATEFHVIAAHPVAHAIVAAAERLGADAICMASHGRSGWSEALAGSVAREVLAASGRPVLVVRPPRPER
jgi:nucleotide-binding universal stress UspA family protein